MIGDIKRILLPKTAKSTCDGCMYSKENDSTCHNPRYDLGKCSEMVNGETVDYIFIAASEE